MGAGKGADNRMQRIRALPVNDISITLSPALSHQGGRGSSMAFQPARFPAARRASRTSPISSSTRARTLEPPMW